MEMPLFYALFYYCAHFCVAAWSTQPRSQRCRPEASVVSPDRKQMGASVRPTRSESGSSPRLLFVACHSDSARSRVSARARTLGTVGRPPRRDAKRPQRRVNTAASAVSAAVRRQKWNFLPEEPTAAPSHRGRRLLLVCVWVQMVQHHVIQKKCTEPYKMSQIQAIVKTGGKVVLNQPWIVFLWKGLCWCVKWKKTNWYDIDFNMFIYHWQISNSGLTICLVNFVPNKR